MQKIAKVNKEVPTPPPYVVEQGITQPARKGSMYPFAEMAVGDSFAIRVERSEAVRQAASKYAMNPSDLDQIKEAARQGAIQGMAEYFAAGPSLASPLSLQQRTEAMLIDAHRKIEKRKARKAAKEAANGKS